ncbi:helix-turn-helix domain-containing protein [Embleya sp. NPDC005575]|uniref:helix-turn-helix domain-containing protein n=1 Tax=Embleya sp. NPDC005575 TaxID=3156892 RepID=UPI0033B5BE66
MSAEHMGMVFKAEGIKGPEKLLLLALTNWTDPYGYCWPGEKRLAADSGTSVSTVQRSKRKLTKMGLFKTLRRTSKNGTPITNLSRVNLVKLASMARKEQDFNDNLIGLEFEFEDDTQGDPETTLAGTPQGDAEDAEDDLTDLETDTPQDDDTHSDLLKRQSDGYHPSDCGVLPVNLTGTTRQSAGQSLSDPVVISDGTDAPPSSARSAPAASASSDVGSARARDEAPSAAGGTAAPATRHHRVKGTNRPGDGAPLGFERVPAAAVGTLMSAMPPSLKEALPKRLPLEVYAAMSAALADDDTGHVRTVDQLAQRIASRWTLGGWAELHDAGRIESHVGALIEIMKHGPCANPRCGDDIDIDTGRSCPACDERRTDRTAARRTGDHGGVPRQNAQQSAYAPF